MSVQQITQAVEQFVADEYNDLLVIKGGWGVGKTYFWRSLIQKNSTHNVIGKTFYSYVSLFGVNSLEELKNAILAGITMSSSVNAGSGVKEWAEQIKKAFPQLAKNIPLLKEWPGGLASAAMFMALRNTLVCFDDIERKGSGLDIRDILGLASLLKEQRDCKIVFIVNDGSFEDKENTDFRRHSEKVIDLEVEFAPTAEEAFDYIFPVNDQHYSVVKPHCLFLDIKNIRTIQRIFRFRNKLIPFIEYRDAAIISHVLKSIVLFIWSYYEKDVGAPSFEHLKKYTMFNAVFQRQGDSIDEQTKQWNRLLFEYGYREKDELQTVLLSFIEVGYFDVTTLSEAINKKEEQFRAEQGQALYREVWKLYSNSFFDNESELISKLLEQFRDNPHLTILELDAALMVLSELGQTQTAEDLMDQHISNMRVDWGSINMEYFNMLHRIKHPRLKERINTLHVSSRKSKTMDEVIRALTKGEWTSEYQAILQAATVDELYAWIKMQNSVDLYSYVHTLLKYTQSSAVDVLRRIASDSILNKMRIRDIYSIDIDKQPD